MADLFSLSASLTLDISRFESEVLRAEALAAGLEGRLDRLGRSIDATMGRLRTLEGAMGGGRAWGIGSRGAEAPAGLDAEALGDALARALSGVSVRLDGCEVGRLLAPEVDRAMGREARLREVIG